MSVTSATLRGRVAAERNMLDTCTVQNITGSTVDANGVEVNTYDTVYGPGVAPLPGKRAGMCRVQSDARREATAEAGGMSYTIQRGHVDFPVGSFRPAVNQVVTITAATLDPLLAGRVFRVAALLHKSQATSYRLVVEETVT